MDARNRNWHYREGKNAAALGLRMVVTRQRIFN